MKVAFVHKDINVDINAGGINTVYLKHIEELEKMGVETITLTSREGNWPFKGKRYILPLDSTRNQKIRQILEDEKPDIVDVFSWNAELLDYVSGSHSCKVVMRADIPMKYYSKENLDEQMAKKCDKIVSISKWCDFEWSSVIGKSTIIIPHACDTTILTSCEKEQNTIVWVGKATDTKGFDLLFQLDDNFFKNYKLTVVCAKTMFSVEEQFSYLKAKGVNIAENLSNEKYFELLAKSQFVLSTARREGFCIAVLEAMLYGAIPIIPYWIGGTTDFVNRHNGIIYKNLKDIPILLQRIKSTKKMSLSNIVKAKKYNWKRIVNLSYKMYKDMINEK